MWKRWLLWGVLIIGVSGIMAPPGVRAEEMRAGTQRLIDFSIEAAPLGLAVRAFALKAGISVSYQPAIVRGKQTRGVIGRYSAADGLSRLLQGTSIVAVEQTNGDYVLRGIDDPVGTSAGGSPGQPDLPPVTVEGSTQPAFAAPASGSLRLTAADHETPRSLVVISPEMIRESNVSSLSAALRAVPGVTFRGADASGSPAGDRPFIRGFDATNSVLVDGIRSSGPQGRELFAIEQVEVIEGPASVYSGRGTGAGSINLVSKIPKSENMASATTGVGTSDFRRQTVDVNRVIDDDVAARLNVMWQESAKAGREDVTGSRWGVAPAITIGMSSAARLTLSYYHLQSDEMPDYSVPYARGGGAPLNVGATPFYGLLSRDMLKVTTDTAQADFRQRLDGGMTLKNLTQYSQVRQSFIATNPQWAGASGDVLSLQAKSGIFDVSALANQTELSGSWGRNEWVVGLELNHEKGVRDAYDVRDQAGNSLVNGASCAVPLNCTSLFFWNPGASWTGTVGAPTGQMRVSTNTDTAALYVLDTLRLTDRWLLNVGGRYDYFRTRTSGANSLAATEGTWNSQLGVVYKPAEQVNIYASFSTSTNPVGADAGSGGDAISVANQNVAPEQGRNLEAGVKWDNAEHTLSATLSAFRAEKTNARISVSRDTILGARQSVRGIAASLRGNITPAWKIFAGFAYLDSTIDDGGTAQAFTGNTFPMVPRRSASIWSSYRLHPAITAGAGATYSDRIFANASNTNFVPAYTKFDAMLAWEVDAHLELQLNLYNLTDKRYYDVAYPVYATIAPARSAVLTARMKF